jgi:hypothetical protein
VEKQRSSQLALQHYRLAGVAVIAWLIRDLTVRQRTQGDSSATPAFPFTAA